MSGVSSIASIFFLRLGLLLNMIITDWLDWLVSDPLQASRVHLPVLRLQACTAMPGVFLHGC